MNKYEDDEQGRGYQTSNVVILVVILLLNYYMQQCMMTTADASTYMNAFVGTLLPKQISIDNDNVKIWNPLWKTFSPLSLFQRGMVSPHKNTII